MRTGHELGTSERVASRPARARVPRNASKTCAAAQDRVRRRGTACAALTLLFITSACTREIRVAGPTGEVRMEGARGRWSNEPVGTWTWSYPGGSARERGTLTDGHRTGEWMQWWSNGEKRSLGRREYDTTTRTSPREGAWTFWHPNGSVAARGIYRRGSREGAWEYSLDDSRLDGDRSGIYHDDVKLADR